MALRNFDTAQQFEAIKKSASDAVKEIFPVEGKLRTIRLLDVSVEDKLDPKDYQSQNQMKLKDGTWGVPVYATLELVDKQSGKAIDRAKIKLFTLPKVTDRFSYIVNGNEYQVQNQLRLKSGVYTIRKQNGELKTQLNLAKGKNFDLAFNERTGLFSIKKVGGGQANIPLYPVLAHLGVSGAAVANSWGSDLQRANVGADPKAVGRFESALSIKSGELKAYLDGTKIGPETTEAVLGERFEKVDGPLLLAASKNLLQVHLGEKEPTDRDSLAFKELHSVEDFIHERIQKNKTPLAFKLKRNIDNPKRTKLSQIVNPGAFHSTVESFFTQDDKSETPEQTNPVEMLSGQYMATVMRSGGITSEHAIKPTTREIHPSHYGFIDPIATPESSTVGVNLHLPMGIQKDGKDLKVAVLVPGTTKVVTITPAEAFNKRIAFPGQPPGPTVKVQYQGKVADVPSAAVDYVTTAPMSLFSWATNLIPYLASNQGNRAMMASKQITQAIALKHREAPLVQVAASANKSFEEHIGQSLAVVAPADGTVKKLTADAIVLQTSDGPVTLNLYNNFTLNRKSFMNHEPVVKVGDRVKKGQLLAESNFTKGGTLALGTNMRVAYLPYKGLNFEDGIVITESAADKLTSEHIHKKTLDVGENHVLGTATFRSFYPNTLAPTNLAKLDEGGVIKKGQVVHHGEALIAAVQRSTPSATIAVVSRALAERPKDASLYWTLDDDGKVIDVQKSGDKITVVVKTEERAKIGDKLAGRVGNKGIITRIIGDHEAPHTADGKPVEVLLNPHGVISRINVGQIYESAAGKAALKSGKPIAIRNFTGEDYLESTRDLVGKAGTPDKEELFDPVTKKSLGKVHVGNPYILKLSKQGTVNFSVRQGGPGNRYDANLQPTKGGEGGSKDMDLLTTYSMLAHGARANLREMSSIKSNQNDEFWKALKSGQPLPPPKSPFVYDKFMGYLRAAGIDVKKDGSKLTLAPLTDKQVRAQSSGEIREIQFYRGKNQEAMKGGFFDPVLTGGFKGEKWNHLELTEPVVNPVFEGAVTKLTGLGKSYDEVVAGRMHLDPKTGELNTEGKGLTGGKAIEHLLKKIDVDAEITALSKKAPKATGPVLDDINKRMRYLMALRTAKLRPEDAYIRKVVPIIPPMYRPIYPLPTGDMTSSSVNYLYQHVGVLNDMAKLPVMDLLAEEEKAPLRGDLHQAVRGISGLTDLTIKGRAREGFISEIKGGAEGQPKEGFFLDKMISKKQDYVGRGTIIPEPDLGVDEMAMPEEMAWKLFEPFVVRELKTHGKSPLQAKEEIRLKTPLARRALDIVMSQRHVLMNRAPSLHKFSIMAFKPKITAGRAIKIPPLVVKGFNADFDGDAMTIHVPITEEANEEAKKMLPSRNLFKPGTNALMVAPSQEAQIGMFYLSQTAAGRKELAAIIGAKFHVPDIFDKKATGALLQAMAKGMPAPEYATAVAKLKAAGERHAYETGFTLGLDDLATFRKDRDAIVRAGAQKANAAKGEVALGKVNEETVNLMDRAIAAKLKGTRNPLYDMVESGSRGDKSQLRSILASPLFMSDARGNTIATPIKKSYSEGLDISDYWLSMYGARKGAIARSIQSSAPGAFSKDVMATTIDNVITAQDCGTKDGVVLKIEDVADAVDRYTAGDQLGVPHNTLVTAQVLGQLKQKGAKTVKVRSPLTCHRPKGICAHCHGLDEHSKLPELGDNVGAKAGQTISEPLIQIVMNARHTGGVAGTGQNVSGYQRIDQLLKLPKLVVGSATLAPKAGRVTAITKGLAGGFNIIIDGTDEAYVEKGLPLKVKVGSVVAAGDALSEGIIKPQDLVRYKGMQHAQQHLVDELHATYHDQGVPIQKRIFETVVRSLGNTTMVLNNPRDTGHIPGDVAAYATVQAYNRNLDGAMPLEEAEGYKLAAAAGSFRTGHELTAADIRVLKVMGVKEVRVSRDPIVHAPFLRGLRELPILKKDWMGALGYQHLKKVITEGASQGWSTDIHGEHPIPAIAAGAEFGKGTQGRY